MGATGGSNPTGGNFGNNKRNIMKQKEKDHPKLLESFRPLKMFNAVT